MNWFMVLLLPFLLLTCGALSALETAVFSLTYHDRMRLARTDAGLAAVIDRMLARPREFLIVNLLLNMTSATLYMVLTTLLGAESGHLWMQIGLAVVNLLLMTLMAEVVSKMVAARYRVGVCRLLGRPFHRVMRVLMPIRVALSVGIIEPLSRLLMPADAGRLEGDSGSRRLSVEELGGLLELGASQGDIASDEHQLLRQVIQLGELRVRDVMTPRVDLEWLTDTATPDEVRELVRRTRLTRVPICKGSLDDGVVGLLNTKRYLAAAAGDRPVKIADFTAAPTYVPQTTSLDRLLENVRGSTAKQAVCVDEHGVIVGIIAAQDVVRRLVAELQSGGVATEPGETPMVMAVGQGQWSVQGRVSVRQWAGMLDLPDDPRITTMAGLVMAQLGRLPAVGDRVVLGNVTLRVESLIGRVVDRVHVSVAAGSGPASAQGVGQEATP